MLCVSFYETKFLSFFPPAIVGWFKILQMCIPDSFCFFVSALWAVYTYGERESKEGGTPRGYLRYGVFSEMIKRCCSSSCGLHAYVTWLHATLELV